MWLSAVRVLLAASTRNGTENTITDLLRGIVGDGRGEGTEGGGGTPTVLRRWTDHREMYGRLFILECALVQRNRVCVRDLMRHVRDLANSARSPVARGSVPELGLQYCRSYSGSPDSALRVEFGKITQSQIAQVYSIQDMLQDRYKIDQKWVTLLWSGHRRQDPWAWQDLESLTRCSKQHPALTPTRRRAAGKLRLTPSAPPPASRTIDAPAGA